MRKTFFRVLFAIEFVSRKLSANGFRICVVENFKNVLHISDTGLAVNAADIAVRDRLFSESRLGNDAVLFDQQGSVLCILNTAPFCGLLQIATPFGVFCLRREVACKIEVANV